MLDYEIFIVEKTTNTLIRLNAESINMEEDMYQYSYFNGPGDMEFRTIPASRILTLKGCEEFSMTKLKEKTVELSEEELMDLIGVNDV